MSNSLTVLKNHYKDLSRAEKAIADCMLNEPDLLARLSVAELSDKAGVAPSTVVRMCKNLGYSGFTQFKIASLPSLSPLQEGPVLMPAISPTDDNCTIFQKVFASDVSALQDTLDMLDSANIERIVALLGEARSITFFGVGTSASVAMDAYYRFMRIGRPAFFATDNHIMRVAASQLHENDVAVALSHTGKTIDTVETLRIAKLAGAHTIALTSYNDSPICSYADEALVVYSDEIRYPIEAVSARVAHIAVLDALCVCLAVRNYENSLEHVKTVQELFRPLRRGKPNG